MMKRYFGGSQRGMGRAVGRAVSGGGGVRVNKKKNSNTTENKISSSSSSSSSVIAGGNQNHYHPHHLSMENNQWGPGDGTRHSSTSSSLSPCFGDPSDVWEWVCVPTNTADKEVEGGIRTANGFVYNDALCFGQVPSVDEVQGALTSIQQFFAPASYPQYGEDGFSSSSDNEVITQIYKGANLSHGVPSAGSKIEWIEPSMQLWYPRTLGNERVYDAFHLLQTDTSLQRAVVSLSTDPALWNAVLNNEGVRELRDIFAAESERNFAESPDGEAKGVLSWLLDNSKAKLMELMEKLTKLLSGVFQQHSHSENAETKRVNDMFGDTLRSSVMVSIIVLIVVVITRAHNA